MNPAKGLVRKVVISGICLASLTLNSCTNGRLYVAKQPINKTAIEYENKRCKELYQKNCKEKENKQELEHSIALINYEF